jgi:polysaccharide export outer membrane protein
MKKKLAILLTIVVLAAMPGLAFAQDYILGPGDVLSISVWGFEDLQAEEMIIRPDGKIAFPFAGELQAAGTNPAELTQTIKTLLAEYIVNPVVTVNIKKYRTTRVYVLGEVTKPGMYEIEKSHTLLDAIGVAGSYTKDAAKKKVHIISRDNPGSPLKVNLMDILQKGDLGQNYTLKEGDIVYLSKSNKFNFAKDIMPLVVGAYYIDRIEE